MKQRRERTDGGEKAIRIIMSESLATTNEKRKKWKKKSSATGGRMKN